MRKRIQIALLFLLAMFRFSQAQEINLVFEKKFDFWEDFSYAIKPQINLEYISTVGYESTYLYHSLAYKPIKSINLKLGYRFVVEAKGKEIFHDYKMRYNADFTWKIPFDSKLKVSYRFRLQSFYANSQFDGLEYRNRIQFSQKFQKMVNYYLSLEILNKNKAIAPAEVKGRMGIKYDVAKKLRLENFFGVNIDVAHFLPNTHFLLGLCFELK